MTSRTRKWAARVLGSLLWLCCCPALPAETPPDPLLGYARCLVPIQVPQQQSHQRSFGTGFLISKPGPVDTAVYLVTARHVLWDYSIGQAATSIQLILMEKTGRGRWKKYSLAADSLHTHLLLHPDSTVDVALVRLDIRPTDYANRFLDAGEILGREDFQRVFPRFNPLVDSAFYVGYQMDSLMKNQLYPQVGRGPLPRFLPTFPSRLTGKDSRSVSADSCLVSRFRLAKGNSGSPVFLLVNQERFRLPNGQPAILLAGIISAVVSGKTTRNGNPSSDVLAYTLKTTLLVPIFQLEELYKKERGK